MQVGKRPLQTATKDFPQSHKGKPPEMPHQGTPQDNMAALQPQSFLESQSYVFDPRPHYPLQITAKRYWNPHSPHLNDESALTLVFAHGTGFHKEQWEPTMDDLTALVGNGISPVKIREMWSIDAPNHGDAAILNEKALQFGYEPVFQWEEYARSISMFLTNCGSGLDVDLSERRLVAVGHSMGAISLMLALGHSPNLHFESLILVDPMFFRPPDMVPESEAAMKADNFLAQGSKGRRDIWDSAEDAYKSLKSRGAWKVWDDRVLRIFVEQGMRPLPTAEYPDKTGVTLKCTRRQETACYRDPLGWSRAYHLLGSLIERVQTHLFYGAIDDYIPAEAKEDVVNNATGGKEKLASYKRVPNCGHLIPQVNPKGLAQAIYESLSAGAKPRAAKL